MQSGLGAVQQANVRKRGYIVYSMENISYAAFWTIQDVHGPEGATREAAAVEHEQTADVHEEHLKDVDEKEGIPQENTP